MFDLRILYITSFIPKRNADQAGINVSFDIIKTIKENINCKIDIAGLINGHQFDLNETKDVKEYVDEVNFIKILKYDKFKNLLNNLSKPAIAAVRYDKRLIEIVKNKAEIKKYDYVICDYTQNLIVLRILIM